MKSVTYTYTYFTLCKRQSIATGIFAAVFVWYSAAYLGAFDDAPLAYVARLFFKRKIYTNVNMDVWCESFCRREINFNTVTRVHQNTPFSFLIKIFWGEAHSLPIPHSHREGIPIPTSTPQRLRRSTLGPPFQNPKYTTGLGQLGT